MSDSSNIIQRKTVINGYVALINYYYIIEDSIVNIYKTTVDYLYPKPVYKSIQGFGEFVIINTDDQDDQDDNNINNRWFNRNLMQSIRRSIYFPKYEYSEEELEKIGYKSIVKNIHFKENKWNCYIYSDKHKYNILSEFIDMWKIKKINIHLVSGLYDPDEYELFSDFNIEMSLTPNTTFHNTHLHDFNKESVLDFMQKNESNKLWQEKDVINLTIINNPQFEIDSDIYNQLTKNGNMFIVFDINLKHFNKFMDYATIPATHITELCKINGNLYPPIHTSDDLYVVYSNPEYDSLVRQLNYIRF